MKNIVYIIAVALCLFSVAAKEDGSATSGQERQDRFEFYGDVDSSLYTMIRRTVNKLYGSPDTSIRYEYPQCYNREGKRILPLHNRYLNHLNRMYSFSVWHNIDNSDEDLIIFFQKYFESENLYDSVFWAIRCAPEEVDSVLSLYTAECVFNPSEK